MDTRRLIVCFLAIDVCVSVLRCCCSRTPSLRIPLDGC